MRKVGLMVGLALVAIACATGADMVGEMMDSGVPDAGAQPTPKPAGEFVGYTSEAYRLNPLDGSEGGLFNTYAACRSEFGESARICTVTEVLGTPNLPAPPPSSDQTGSGIAGAWLIANNLDTVPRCWNASSLDNDAPYLTSAGAIWSDEVCSRRRVLACCTVN